MSKAKPEQPEKTLAAYVAERKAAMRKCTVCRLPQRPKIEEGRRDGQSFQLISDWLRDVHKVSLCSGAVADHFRNGHDVKANAR
jgi:hypothetical protein